MQYQVYKNVIEKACKQIKILRQIQGQKQVMVKPLDRHMAINIDGQNKNLNQANRNR